MKAVILAQVNEKQIRHNKFKGNVRGDRDEENTLMLHRATWKDSSI
jgi:hypothetical protein